MSSTVKVFGQTYTGVEGIKADDGSGNTLTFTIGGGGSPTLQTKSVSVTPSETVQSQTVTADSGYDGLDEVSVSVGAISSSYVGSGITRRSSNDLTASGRTITVPSGYYQTSASKSISSNYVDTSDATLDNAAHLLEGVIAYGEDGDRYVGALEENGLDDITISGDQVRVYGGYFPNISYVKNIPHGTEGTPTATKGTVSNHSVSVTPSVTNSAGYISGGTHAGTAVTVSASELVSGSETKTANGTYDVTNLAELVVKVSSSGSSMNTQVWIGRAARTANSYGATTATLTVAKTGTYTVSWSAWRSSSSGTMGTNLHVNNTTGTNQQTWTNTYGQQIQLTGQNYNKGDVLTVYATSGSSSRTINVANLVIVQTA